MSTLVAPILPHTFRPSGGWIMRSRCLVPVGSVLSVTRATIAPVSDRLEELRTELRAEQISMGELAELAGMADQIDPSDVELLEAAGVPEFPEIDEVADAEEDTPENGDRLRSHLDGLNRDGVRAYAKGIVPGYSRYSKSDLIEAIILAVFR